MPEPIRDDAIASASIDDLNPRLAVEALVFAELDASDISAPGQKISFDEDAALLKKVATWAVVMKEPLLDGTADTISL